MQYAIRITGSGDNEVAQDGYALGYAIEEQGERLVLTRPDGSQVTIGKEKFTHFDISLGETPVAVAHYSEPRDNYCCVTCNGFTTCATNPCCRTLPTDPWTCC